MRIERLKVCLNGNRPPGAHPGLPVTPEDSAVAARAAVAAGAEAVHLHPRDATGRESLAAGDIGAAVAAVRAACPGVPVGVSTGLWITGADVPARLAAARGWADLPAAARPDFASANLSEPGFVELVGALRTAGFGVEAGVFSLADADTLAASGLAADCERILVEIVDGPAAEAGNRATGVLSRLDALGVEGTRLLHGEEVRAWPLVALAGRLGLPTRIGLEDALSGPDGTPVTDNAELVAFALHTWTAAHATHR